MTSTSDQSTAELVRQASAQISTLIRDELRLAQLELLDKARHAALGAGMFGSAAVVAVYGLAALIAATGLALALIMPGWAAALVVGAALFLLAGLQVQLGRRQLRQATPLAPQRAVQGLKADAAVVGGAVEGGRRR